MTGKVKIQKLPGRFSEPVGYLLNVCIWHSFMRQAPSNLSQFSPDHSKVNIAQPSLYLSVTSLAPKGDWLQNPKGDKRTNDGPLKNVNVFGQRKAIM